MNNEENHQNYNKKVAIATKWSASTELIVKIIQPITSIILARILVPEDYGIVANLTMIVSFAEMLADAGFSKYIIQHRFESKEELTESSNVAFWTNLIVALSLFGIICLFRNLFASWIGSSGYEIPLVVSSIAIPLFALISIQRALYIRNLNFKTLFYVRIFSSFIPFLITVPIAALGGGFWALIFGSLSTNILNVFILSIKSTWKPQWHYSFLRFRAMFVFSSWTLVESIVIWLTGWIDIFLINKVLSAYQIGLYKNSISIVNAIIGIITATFIPVLFSALSKKQNDKIEFVKIYERNQKIVAYLVIPMGIGIFLFRDFITNILLGSNWNEAAIIIGLWSLSSGFVIVYSGFASEVYRAKGLPRVSVLHQVIWLIIIVPMVLIGLKRGFEYFILYRIIARLSGIIISFVLLKIFINFPLTKNIINTFLPIIASCLMGLLAIFIKSKLPQSNLYSILEIFICIIFYFLFVRIFCKKDYFEIKNYLFKNK